MSVCCEIISMIFVQVTSNLVRQHSKLLIIAQFTSITACLRQTGLNVIRIYGNLAVLLLIRITKCWFWNSNVNACSDQCMLLSERSMHASKWLPSLRLRPSHPYHPARSVPQCPMGCWRSRESRAAWDIGVLCRKVFRADVHVGEAATVCSALHHIHAVYWWLTVIIWMRVVCSKWCSSASCG